jgi:hypothetical protein
MRALLNIQSMRKDAIGSILISRNHEIIDVEFYSKKTNSRALKIFNLEDVLERDAAFREMATVFLNLNYSNSTGNYCVKSLIGVNPMCIGWISLGYWNMKILLQIFDEGSVRIEAYVKDEHSDSLLYLRGIAELKEVHQFGNDLSIILD